MDLFEAVSHSAQSHWNTDHIVAQVKIPELERCVDAEHGDVLAQAVARGQHPLCLPDGPGIADAADLAHE